MTRHAKPKIDFVAVRPARRVAVAGISAELPPRPPREAVKLAPLPSPLY
jgi:hypothetical protein